jgi:hypothetical protein
MNIYTYETESVAFEGGCVEIVTVLAESREAADRAMLQDPGCWVWGQTHLENVYKVEEKPLTAGAVVFRGKVLERLDPHEYAH